MQREDSVPAYESVAEQDFTNESGWKAVADKVWEYEQSTIAGWNRQIDTLLVFVSVPSLVTRDPTVSATDETCSGWSVFRGCHCVQRSVLRYATTVLW